jgi:hypothetical protein
LANGDYGDVNRELKKIISKDSNIQVSCKQLSLRTAVVGLLLVTLFLQQLSSV